MKYIWVNPVAASMYNRDVLHTFLKKHGYFPIDASGHWLGTVREKYKTALQNSKKTVIDMRCPKISSLVDAYGLREQVTLPEIEPILLHCGREISKMTALQGCEKIITTPCQALADQGNALGLENTTFLPWDRFLCSIDDQLSMVLPKESPIPPGFFDALDCKKISVTGKEDICDFFEHFEPESYDLIELLYCKNGCHNGDGICGCK